MSTQELQVCIECKHPSRIKQWQSKPGGKDLYDKLAHQLKATKVITVRPVACLGNCSCRCRVSVTGRNRWTWLLGDINPDKDISFVLSFVSDWLNADKGLIPKGSRSEKLIKKALGRVPPMNNCSGLDK